MLGNTEFTADPSALQAAGAATFTDISSRNDIHAFYLHVPFCFHKCHYCDFYSVVSPEDVAEARQRDFTDALIREIEQRAAESLLRPRTIFIGGGTPTLLAVEHWDRLLDRIGALGLLDGIEEFTVEANPETVTSALMRRLVAGGVNRVSIGAQSFDLVLLKTLERWHDPASVDRAMDMVRDAGINNVNLDLIFAIPGQTLDTLDADLDRLLSLKPGHISAYSLIFEPHTALTTKLRQGRIARLDEDLERAMYERVIERFAEAGFEHYEVSNWAKCESENKNQQSGARRCRHNLAYWTNLNWLGLGPAASSHVAGRRWKNQPHLLRYLDESPRPPTMDHEQLDSDASRGEQLMLRLRLLEGIPLDWLKMLLPAENARHTIINELVAIEMLERTATHLRLTRRGLFVADTVLGKLL